MSTNQLPKEHNTTEAILAERERIARLCDALHHREVAGGSYESVYDWLAKRIRAGDDADQHLQFVANTCYDYAAVSFSAEENASTLPPGAREQMENALGLHNADQASYRNRFTVSSEGDNYELWIKLAMRGLANIRGVTDLEDGKRKSVSFWLSNAGIDALGPGTASRVLEADRDPDPAGSRAATRDVLHTLPPYF